MEHMRILRRAFSITLNYRALWLFGILVALATARGSGGNNNGVTWRERGNWPPDNWPNFPGLPNIPDSTIITVVISLICFFLLLGIVFTVLRYISETALIRMVNEHESTGEKHSIRQGFQIGRSRAALRIFLIDLLFGFGGFIVFVLFLMITLAPLLLWATNNRAMGFLGTIITVGLAVFLIFLTIVVAIALGLVSQFMRRAAVLEDRGVFDAIRRGFELVRSRLGDIVVMGLILFGLGLGWAIVMIPVVLLLVMVAALIGGLPALLVGFIANQFVQGALPWVIAAIVGTPVFLLVLVAPLLFLNGLAEVFKSSTWTLTFREVLALESAAPGAQVYVPPAEDSTPTDDIASEE
jgi:hypothetical protein